MTEEMRNRFKITPVHGIGNRSFRSESDRVKYVIKRSHQSNTVH